MSHYTVNLGTDEERGLFFFNHSGSQEVPQISLQACQCNFLKLYRRPVSFIISLLGNNSTDKTIVVKSGSFSVR